MKSGLQSSTQLFSLILDHQFVLVPECIHHVCYQMCFYLRRAAYLHH